MPELINIKTDPVIVASEGQTLNNFTLTQEVLESLAKNYDPDFYDAKVLYNHSDYSILGHVKELKLVDHPKLEGKKALSAVILPNEDFIRFNKNYNMGSNFSIGFTLDMPDKGAYLQEISLTDFPASTGTTTMKLSESDKKPENSGKGFFKFFGKEDNKLEDETENRSKDCQNQLQELKEQLKNSDQKLKAAQEEAKKQISLNQEKELELNELKQAADTEEKEKLQTFSGASEEKKQNLIFKTQEERHVLQSDEISKRLFSNVAASFHKKIKFSEGQNQYTFNVDPGAVDYLLDDWKKKNTLLNRINIVPVMAKSGRKIYASIADRNLQRKSTKTFSQAINTRSQNYETMFREIAFLLSWDLIDSYRHLGDMAGRARSFWTESEARDLADLCLIGIDRENPASEFKKIDYGFKQRLLNYQNESNVNSTQVFERWKTGSSVILVGANRTIAISGSSTTAAGKTTIPASGHGFVKGGHIILSGSGDLDGTYVLDSTTTKDNLVISGGSDVSIPAGATAKQEVDFSSMDELVAVAKRYIPEHKRSNLECWSGDALIGAQEQKIYAGLSSEHPGERAYVPNLMVSHAGLPVYDISGLPANDFVITDPRNLSIYLLSNSVRNEYKENDHEHRGATFSKYMEMSNEVEDYQRTIWLSNVHFIKST